MPTDPGAPMLNQKLFVTRTVQPWPDLYERWWDGDEWIWVNHGRPEGILVRTAPGAAMMDRKLFVGIQDGRLFERFWDGSRWVWVDHGRPPGTGVSTAPGAAMMNQKLFVGAADGRLFERFWDGSRWVWVDHGRPPGTGVSTAPGAAMMDRKLFVGTQNQRLFERFWDGSQWVWVDHGTLLHDTRATLLDNTASGHPTRTIVTIGDGFSETDLDNYRNYVQTELMQGVLGRDLFGELRSAFNVIRMDLVSIDSGVSRRTYDEKGTPNNPSDDTIISENFRNTRLGYIFSGSWSHCWMEETAQTQARLLKVLRRFAPNWNYALVVLNESGYGGCARGPQQVVTRGVDWRVIYHEFGHGIGGLSDEYERSGNAFTGTAWNGPNCSVTARRQDLRWADLVGPRTRLPTSETNPPAGWNPNTDVGAFEGCGTFESRLFRPVLSCRMRDNAPPFCPVCARVLRGILSPSP
jgi:IgA Peptidase M64